MSRPINEVMKELAEYTTLQNELKLQVEALQDEVKQYMTDNALDEVLTEEGIRATYKECQQSRFNSTAFKKDFLDIYQEYCQQIHFKKFVFKG